MNQNVYVPDGKDLFNALKRTTHLAIGAHQDDLELMAFHGISECYKSKSKWFSGVVITDGGGSPRQGRFRKVSNQKMSQIRIREQQRAAQLGGYSVQFQLGYPSRVVKDQRQRPAIIEDCFKILMEARPKVVYLHNPMDRHDTHVAVFFCALEALRRMPKRYQPKEIYGCEVWRGLDWLSDQDKVPLGISKNETLGLRLCQCFQSQIAGGKRYDLAIQGRWRANATFFESHLVDKESSVALSIDLMPLLRSKMSVKQFVLARIESFKRDIVKKIDKSS